MIHIELKSKESGELHSCKVSGHAGFANKGEDVVCAAVSILVRVAVLQLQEWAKDARDLKVSLDCQRLGNVSFCVLHNGEGSKEALVHLFSFLKIGFESLACEYQEFVRLDVY